MSLQAFCPVQMGLTGFGFDSADALKRDYAILKNQFSLSGLSFTVRQLAAEACTKLPNGQHWHIAYESCMTNEKGEVYFAAIDVNGRPVFVATTDARGEFWQPYVMQEYAEYFPHFVDWQHPDNQ